MKKLRIQFAFLHVLPLLCLSGIVLPAVTAAFDQPLVMVTEEWPPFRINDDTTHSGFRGIDIDIVKQVADRLGVPISIQRHPWARALEMMRNGTADMITGVAHTEEREAFMQYVPVAYCSVRPVFFAQKGKGSLVRSYRDLSGKTIGYSLHSAYFEPFNSDTKLNKRGLSTEQQLLQVLALGRLDLIIGTEPNISYDRARLGYVEETEPTVYQPDETTELFFALSKKSGSIRYAGALAQVLQDLLTDGTVAAILEQYR
ncbi:MAG: transporter substrate-binding domain-containing protein [Desulfofustis sp.]|jgi:polar amino acid transport system substrate-binding protein|nr:transporter substrate-binding domain-containing protein [Desulfofustis sp.]